MNHNDRANQHERARPSPKPHPIPQRLRGSRSDGVLGRWRARHIVREGGRAVIVHCVLCHCCKVRRREGGEWSPWACKQALGCTRPGKRTTPAAWAEPQQATGGLSARAALRNAEARLSWKRGAAPGRVCTRKQRGIPLLEALGSRSMAQFVCIIALSAIPNFLYILPIRKYTDDSLGASCLSSSSSCSAACNYK